MVTHGCACCAEHRPEHRRTTAKQPSAHPIPASIHNGTPPQTPGTGRPPPPPAASPRNTGTFGGHRRRPRHATPPGARNPPQARRTTVGNRAGDAPHARHRRRTGRQRKRALGTSPRPAFPSTGRRASAPFSVFGHAGMPSERKARLQQSRPDAFLHVPRIMPGRHRVAQLVQLRVQELPRVLLQCLFSRLISIFPQCGRMVFPGLVIMQSVM